MRTIGSMKFKWLVFFSLLSLFSFKVAFAQSVQTQNVNYDGQPVIDSDLDGLTDEGEKQIYHTDPNKADTDGDGFSDGAEVLAGSDPLDPNSIPGSAANQRAINIASSVTGETPWAWYISRASGLIGFVLLYISMFLVLTIRIPFLRKIFAPAISLNVHGWMALQATIFAFAHGMVLIFDKFIGMSAFSVLVPFASSYQPIFVGLGTIGFYLMVILVVTSYARKYMSFKLWRAIHFLNIILYLGVIAHALALGTDLKNHEAREFFIAANALLIVLMLANMFMRIRQNILAKRAVAAANINTQTIDNANIY